MKGRALHRIAIAAVVAFDVAACIGPTPTPSPASGANAITVNNFTTIPVTVVVNGVVMATVSANTNERPIPVVLPDRPWIVQAISPTGHVLLTLTVSPTDDISAESAVGNSAFLECGELELWAGGAIGDFPHPPTSPLPCD